MPIPMMRHRTELPATMTDVPGIGTSTDTFSYNPRSEVTGSINDKDAALNRGYGYDPIGNRLSAAELNISKEYDSNVLNQYTAIRTSGQSASSAVNNLTYDADGNMLADGEGKTYTWDAENRLIAVTLPNGEIVKYTYDAGSHRVKREHVYASCSEMRSYVYSKWDVLLEKKKTNLPTENSRFYLWGLGFRNAIQEIGGIGGLLFEEIQSPIPNLRFHIFDASGNISELLDANLVLNAHKTHDVFGDLIKTHSITENGIYQFSTKEYDELISLIYYGRRWYSPGTGSWMSRDPAGEIRGSLYEFNYNSPVNYVDMNGEIPEGVGSFIVDKAVEKAVSTAISAILSSAKDEINKLLLGMSITLNLAHNCMHVTTGAQSRVWNFLPVSTVSEEFLLKKIQEVTKDKSSTEWVEHINKGSLEISADISYKADPITCMLSYAIKYKITMKVAGVAFSGNSVTSPTKQVEACELGSSTRSCTPLNCCKCD